MENENVFSTRDLYLAASLVTLKFKLIQTNFQIEGERSVPVGYFIFEKTPALEETVRLYWASELMIEPRAFTTSMRGLKAQVTNVFKNPTSKFSGLAS